MKPIKSTLVVFSFFGLISASTEVLALGQVSRACRFADLPIGTKTLAAKFFWLLGASSDTRFLADAPNSTQQKKWVLESLTTDYGSVRYYLYAESGQYVWYPGDAFGPPSWLLMRAMASPRFDSLVISDAIKIDGDFAKFYNNRMLLFSVRAGASQIVEDFDPSAHFRVVGKHYYKDANAPSVSRLPDSVATDCNLMNWGIEGNGFFNR